MADSSCRAYESGYNCGVRSNLKPSSRSTMPAICQPHNLRRPVGQGPKPYGVRVSLSAGRPFPQDHGRGMAPRALVCDGCRAGRDVALADMSRKHEYSRVGDKPALLFEKVENLAASRGL